MSYQSIHTLVGLELMAQAEATGTQIQLTHMAVGDGNGNPVTPNEDMTQLVRERYRGEINTVWQDPEHPNMFSAELIVPATVGGFVIREIGVFDSNGNLFIVGNLPDITKPVGDGSDGTLSDASFRVDFITSNAGIIELIIDPNVVYATRSWVINTITPAYLFPGGTTGQVLKKKSNADGDTEWADPADVNVFVDVLEETQTLADAQVIVDWAIVTNTGLAVYVDGQRLRADEWTPDPDINTRITLAAPYAAGLKIVGAQNEPAGSLPDPLVKSQNLADVPDKAAARANLGIVSSDETRQMAPPGLIAHFARQTAPTGWIKANGAAVSRTAYSALFAAIGTAFGAGDGATTFNLPDLRGEAIRGWDDGRGVDGGRAFGSAQGGSIQSHTHTASSATAGDHGHTGSSASAGDHNHSATAANAGGHAHSAHSDSAGAHSHNVNLRVRSDFLTDGQAWSTGSGTAAAENHTNSPYGPIALSAGAHAHVITVNAAGDHAHSVSVGNGGAHTHGVTINNAGNHTHGVTVNAAGSAETRMRNVALLACIKF